MRAIDRYMLRVLADEWTPRAAAPSLLDISRAGDGLGAELRKARFRVTSITLQDGSLESLGERLAGVMETFDAICCRDVLELVDDWDVVLGRIARRLRPGGILVYSVGATTAAPGLLPRLMQRWLGSRPTVERTTARHRPVPAADLVATLRPFGLLPRELTVVGASAGAARGRRDAYVGYSVRRADRSAPLPGMRWEFTGTGERWMAGSRQVW